MGDDFAGALSYHWIQDAVADMAEARTVRLAGGVELAYHDVVLTPGSAGRGPAGGLQRWRVGDPSLGPPSHWRVTIGGDWSRVHPRYVGSFRQDEAMTATVGDTAALRKARGAFFTPGVVARYVTDWAVRSSADVVLEPSCGEAAFLLEAGLRLRALGMAGAGDGQLHGAELHEASAAKARTLSRSAGFETDVVVGDFLARPPLPVHDAVIGNPPYVRYQAFSGESRAVAKQAALRGGVSLTNLASSWAAFTVHAALHVRPGGRLGLVLPAEMLSVNYAAPVREFLMAQFARVRLVLFTERVFPGVMEDVVLLLAEGRGVGPTRHCELLQARNAEALATLTESSVTRWRPAPGQRWSGALVDQDAAHTYARVVASEAFSDLEHWGDTTLGMVTGNNGFFTLTEAEKDKRRLDASDTVRLSPPGSRHLRGLSLTAAGLAALDAAGSPTWLFRPDREPSRAGLRYIAEGKARGVDEAYKCRVRTPWWRVPYQPPADLLLTYMNADTARLCRNAAGAHHLNSVHGVYLRPEHRRLGQSLLALAGLNSVTMLGAEIVGRSYGGGVLKIEPREADVWPVPSPGLITKRTEMLRAVAAQVRSELNRGATETAANLVDDALGIGDLLSSVEVRRVREARRALVDRRTARSRSR